MISKRWYFHNNNNYMYYMSGFCHFGLMSFMGFVTEPWHYCHVMFSRERAASSVLKCLVSCWSVVFRYQALMSWVSVSCQGSYTRAPRSVSLFECAVASSLRHVLFCSRLLCFVLHTVHVLSAACIPVMSGAVWHAACVFHWLRVFMLSCLVWTRGLWVFSLAVCSCPVLHMAGDLFCWPCACVFVLCEHMAFVLVFCVPCALMLIVLTPPILFPDYWFICPTCLPSLPSSFASFIYIYIYAFSRCFYPKAIQAIHFFLSVCVFPGNWTHDILGS